MGNSKYNFKDRCDICHLPKEKCRGYRDKIICPECMMKIKDDDNEKGITK